MNVSRNNAFDYEGKEFAGGGMQMGGVQDYVEYMKQYAWDLKRHKGRIEYNIK